MSINLGRPPVAAPAGRPEDLPPQLAGWATELRTFYRHLPHLIADGEVGRYVVVRGGETHGVWDTARDASQYGHEKFDDGRFLSQKIDPQMGLGLAVYFWPWCEPEPTDHADRS